MKYYILIIILISCICAQAEILNNLYIVGWRDGLIQNIQGTSVVNAWDNAGDDELPIVVLNDRIRTFAYYDNGTYGAEYTLDGQATGTTYAVFPAKGFHDGATDGQYFYSWSYYTSTLYRFNTDWSNPTVMFSLTGSSRLGITYDPSNDSFWISGWGSGIMENYSKTGELLSSFATYGAYTGGVAMDYTDDTIWANNQYSHTFVQYDRDGTQLQVIDVTGISGNIYSGEFAYNSIPEPSTCLLAGCLILFILKIRK